jgi:hypothetical protein
VTVADDDRKGRASSWIELGKVVAMPLVTLIVGYLLNSSLNYSQTRDSNLRLYADMMGRREEADSALRKDMFQSILTSFVQPAAGQAPNPESQVLNLELLAYNFHESLDLGPLFRHVQRQLQGHGPAGQAPLNAKDLEYRLERVAEEVKERQLAAISDSGSVERGELDVNMGGAEAWFLGKSTIPLKAGQQRGAATICLSLRASDPTSDTVGERSRQFRVEYLSYSPDRREVELSLAVSKPLPRAECEQIQEPATERANTETTVQFWAGPFGFPMIDNTRLTGSERCSVSVIRIVDNSVTLAIAYFPASRASLKDKPYYDEVLNDLLRQPSAVGVPK